LRASDFIRAATRYAARDLRQDLAAGVALAAVAISSQLGTAHLAGLLPTAGLIAFAAGAIGFAAFGANRFLVACADSTIAPIFAGGLATLAATGSRDYFALWWPPGRDLKGETIEGVLVIAFQAPRSFLNAHKFQDGAQRRKAKPHSARSHRSGGK
jgi:MFS superfamily sulfate permease-like transporter